MGANCPIEKRARLKRSENKRRHASRTALLIDDPNLLATTRALGFEIDTSAFSTSFGAKQPCCVRFISLHSLKNRHPHRFGL
jgi:hypothetical protein